MDTGHGGADVGAVHSGANGTVDLVEKDVNLDVAKRLGALLAADGFQVVQGRADRLRAAAGAPGGADRPAVRLDMQARVYLADAVQADLFIAIHHNGFGNPAAVGQ